MRERYHASINMTPARFRLMIVAWMATYLWWLTARVTLASHGVT